MNTNMHTNMNTNMNTNMYKSAIELGTVIKKLDHFSNYGAPINKIKTDIASNFTPAISEHMLNKGSPIVNWIGNNQMKSCDDYKYKIDQTKNGELLKEDCNVGYAGGKSSCNSIKHDNDIQTSWGKFVCKTGADLKTEELLSDLQLNVKSEVQKQVQEQVQEQLAIQLKRLEKKEQNQYSVFNKKVQKLDTTFKNSNIILLDNKNRNSRIQNEINDKNKLILTRKRMLELSRDKNIYKQKLIYTYIAVISGIIITLLLSYYYFNK
jgi:hypothetical protein